MVSQAWGAFDDLNMLHVDHNSLSGFLPASFGNLHELRILSLGMVICACLFCSRSSSCTVKSRRCCMGNGRVRLITDACGFRKHCNRGSAARIVGKHDESAVPGRKQQLWHLWESADVCTLGAGEAAGGFARLRPGLGLH